MPTIQAMEAMHWRLVRRLSALVGVTAMLLLTAAPAAAQPDGTLLDAPTLPLADLGSDATLSFYEGTSTAEVTIPVPAGLLPAALNTTLDLPFNIQYGLLTVTQDDRLVSKIGLPLADLVPVSIPLNGVQVAGDSVTLSLTMTVLPQDGFCIDQFNPVSLINGSVSYTGVEIAPTTVADFLPPILRRLTIAVPPMPSQAESAAAVQLATALVARYRSQAPQVVLVPLADGANTPSGPPAPMERQIVLREGPDEGLSLTDANGARALVISGQGEKLGDQARLLTDPSLNVAVSAQVVAGRLHSSTWLPGDSTTLAQLEQPVLTSVGVSPEVGIALDQTRFGHSTQGFRVHLMGSYTPVPAAFGAQMTASVAGEIVDTWPADAGGSIDRWVDIPDRLVQRYTSLAVRVNTSGDFGQCGDFQPITLTVRGNTVVESTPALPPIPPGFSSLPQALMPQMQIGIGADTFADTVRATQIAVGLQRLSVVPLSTAVTSLEQAADSADPAILISADGWTDDSIALPVSANDREITLAGANPDEQTTLSLDPGIQFGSLQTVFDGQRSVLVATSNGAPGQLDELLRWLDGDPQRWTRLGGSAVIAVAGQEPVSVAQRTPASVYGPPDTAANQEISNQSRSTLMYWVAGGVVVGIAIGAAAVWLRTRRSRSVQAGAPRHGGGHP